MSHRVTTALKIPNLWLSDQLDLLLKLFHLDGIIALLLKELVDLIFLLGVDYEALITTFQLELFSFIFSYKSLIFKLLLRLDVYSWLWSNEAIHTLEIRHEL